MNKLLSIIIPTKNRQIYCVESIKSILEDLDERCEIVVQDNSDINSLESMLDELHDDRIVYNYNKNPLSFVDNFEAALSLSEGEYFIILGDDDSTTKNILSVVEWMVHENIESVSSSFVVDYIWPNEKIEKYKRGYLAMPVYNGELRDIDVSKNLRGLINNGFLCYQIFNLPRTYHGIVKRSCMDDVKKVGGRYFGGLTPDIYSTVALSCIIKNHKVIDYPFSIAGACPASATANVTVGGHSGNLEDAPHFNHRGVYEWEVSIPKYYSVETIWAESAIKALKDMQYTGWEKEFNNYKLYVYGIFANRKYIFSLAFKETIRLSKKLNISSIRHMLKLNIVFFNIVYKKMTKHKEDVKSVKYCNIVDIYDLKSCKDVVYGKLKNVFKVYESN